MPRQTKQKRIILKELEHMKGFFSSDELYSAVKAKDDRIGIATVYRFLKDAKERNVIYSYLCNRRRVYSSEKRSHCHFICENSGKIVHFDVDSLDFLRNKIPGDVNSFQLEVRGVCKECEK